MDYVYLNVRDSSKSKFMIQIYLLLDILVNTNSFCVLYDISINAYAPFWNKEILA